MHARPLWRNLPLIVLSSGLMFLFNTLTWAQTDSPQAGDPVITAVQEAYLKASNTDKEDFFGYSVAISGDTAVVGAINEDSNATGVNGYQGNDPSYGIYDGSGAAYVYVHDGAGNWSQQAYLKASNTDDKDGFGYAVAIDGDTIVISAPGEDSSSNQINGDQNNNDIPNTGAAYVFVRDNEGNWTQQAYLKPSTSKAWNEFGYQAVAISGDTIIVGVTQEGYLSEVNGDPNVSYHGAGAAYVFARDAAGNWSEQAKLEASNGEGVLMDFNDPDPNNDYGDSFGYSVSIDGDLAIIGAPGEDSNATGINGDEANNDVENSGAAYIYERDEHGNWNQQAYLKASNSANRYDYGFSTAISGNTAAVGELGTGSVYIYVRDVQGNWSRQAILQASNGEETDNFGWFVAIDGDNLIVSASMEDSSSSGVNGDGSNNDADGSGSAYVFVRDVFNNWRQLAYLKASNPDPYDFFGWSVSISDYKAIVSAYYEDSNSTGVMGGQGNDPDHTYYDDYNDIYRNEFNSGAAYIFGLTTTLSINDTIVYESDGFANFTISRTGLTNTAVSVDVSTADDTATASDDFSVVSTTVNFAVGETSKVVSVAINPDNIDEPDETFYVNLSNPSVGVILDSQGVGTILDDDDPPTETPTPTSTPTNTSTPYSHGEHFDAYIHINLHTNADQYTVGNTIPHFHNRAAVTCATTR